MEELRIPFENLVSTLTACLIKQGFEQDRAIRCASLFAQADRDGVHSHGVNRFFLFLDFIKKGFVIPQNDPELTAQIGMMERYDGRSGPGNLNAEFAMDRAVKLAKSFGMSAVTLMNTNHWMRAGNFGWQAADAGCIGICFTNTIANMPTWGGSEPKLGNNPLVIAIPRSSGHVVLDMAMSQFAYGKMEIAKKKGEQLPFDGGFDSDGNLTKSPEEILLSHLALPTGMWKGAGLSLMLDLLVTVLSGGNSTTEVGKDGVEKGLSQVFICFDPAKLNLTDWMESKIDSIIADLKSSSVFENKSVRYPGEQVLQIRESNLNSGIPINTELWDKLLTLSTS
jgi:3-dehydro-L-gulonate 2-dehydrogenase